MTSPRLALSLMTLADGSAPGMRWRTAEPVALTDGNIDARSSPYCARASSMRSTATISSLPSTSASSISAVSSGTGKTCAHGWSARLGAGGAVRSSRACVRPLGGHWHLGRDIRAWSGRRRMRKPARQARAASCCRPSAPLTRMPKTTAYNSGTTTRVRPVAKIRPNMMVTAMLRKNGSTSSGATPSTVVAAPRKTGRARLTAASSTAW